MVIPSPERPIWFEWAPKCTVINISISVVFHLIPLNERVHNRITAMNPPVKPYKSENSSSSVFHFSVEMRPGRLSSLPAIVFIVARLHLELIKKRI